MMNRSVSLVSILRFCLGGIMGGSTMAAEKIETAEAAWRNLVGTPEAAVQRPAYAWVEHDPALPNVFLYGDSISIGYTPGVRTHLAGRANVYRLHRNGGESGSFVAKFTEMESVMRTPGLVGGWDFSWDVIHFNVGLHDLKFVDASGKLDLAKGRQVATVETYARNLRAIIRLLKTAAPQAKLIFALTTPVPPEAAGRIEGSEAAYNDAARAVLADFPDIDLNDLNRASRPFMQPGNVHFKPEGVAAQAKHVAAFIAERLPK